MNAPGGVHQGVSWRHDDGKRCSAWKYYRKGGGGGGGGAKLMTESDEYRFELLPEGFAGGGFGGG